MASLACLLFPLDRCLEAEREKNRKRIIRNSTLAIIGIIVVAYFVLKK